MFNHYKLNEEQITYLNLNYNCEKIIYLPENLRRKFANIDPAEDSLLNSAQIFKKFISDNTNINDYVVIQGEFGITCLLVNYCFKTKRIPLYATSERKSFEVKLKDGSVIKESKFKFVRFRKYENNYEL